MTCACALVDIKSSNGPSNQLTNQPRSISRLYYFAPHRRFVSAKIRNDFRNILSLLLLFVSLSFPYSFLFGFELRTFEEWNTMWPNDQGTQAFKETDYNDYIKYITTDLMTTYLQTYYTFTAHETWAMANVYSLQ